MESTKKNKKKVIKKEESCVSNFRIGDLVVVSIIALFIGIISGILLSLSYLNTSNNNTYTSEYDSLIKELEKNYYMDIDINSLNNSSFSGLINGLNDDNSYYVEDSFYYDNNVNGYYSGIGSTVIRNENGEITIDQVFDGSPAEEAGLLSGDIVVTVNGETIDNLTLSQYASLIRNNNIGSIIKLKVKRNNEDKEFDIKVSKIDLKSVDYILMEDNDLRYGYISISYFTNNTGVQFNEALNKAISDNVDNLIIDLRDNSGGSISSVIESVSSLVDNNTIIYNSKVKGVTSKVLSTGQKKYNGNTIVLVNNNTNGVSEVFASAMQNNGSTIIGQNTSGSFLLQKTIRLSSGASVVYSNEEWMDSNGNSLEGIGVNPDVEVELVDGHDSIFEAVLSYLRINKSGV